MGNPGFQISGTIENVKLNFDVSATAHSVQEGGVVELVSTSLPLVEIIVVNRGLMNSKAGSPYEGEYDLSKIDISDLPLGGMHVRENGDTTTVAVLTAVGKTKRQIFGDKGFKKITFGMLVELTLGYLEKDGQKIVVGYHPSQKYVLDMSNLVTFS